MGTAIKGCLSMYNGLETELIKRRRRKNTSTEDNSHWFTWNSFYYGCGMLVVQVLAGEYGSLVTYQALCFDHETTTPRHCVSD